MWKHRESHLVDIYKTNPESEKKATMQTSDAKPIYPGCEFDVFQSTTQSKEDQFAPLYSVEKVTPKPIEPYQAEDVYAQANQTTNKHATPSIAHVFIQPTASIHTPIANMFLEKQKDDSNQVDLEYA
ncbi:hypothetical protein A0J61_03119 [Choanephora cucurbitarum]|uniref:Uncharacterized protein n=1 Tax=Choanephora cucurbitarum TaxID=101091 RepID=A0A1C7NIA4_9FUNG|nr:hypothetical protein A0J61_03119 [Choanephora cucurbitarum]